MGEGEKIVGLLVGIRRNGRVPDSGRNFEVMSW